MPIKFGEGFMLKKYRKSMKLRNVVIMSLMLLCVCHCELYASPAYPRKIIVTVADGKKVEIYIRGDESFKYGVTMDGYTLLNDAGEWWYADVTERGEMKKTEFRLVAEGDESVELKRFKSECEKGLIPQSKLIADANRALGMRSVHVQEPVVGERRALVILMQYEDLPFKTSRDDFERLFNSIGYSENGATGSVRDFYRFASQNQLDYISDVYGPYTAQFPMSYYGANSMYGGNDMRPLELCMEAVRNLPDDFDFSPYDNNGDGLVDNVHIIFAGYGEEAGASSDAIWAHEYPYKISLGSEYEYSLASYSCSPELSGNSGSKICNIGVICHELGHALGAMDYYDTDYGTGGEYVGTGEWDIMAGGSWNDDGRTPPNFNPFVRCNVFGWSPLVVLKSNQQVTMSVCDSGDIDPPVVYKMETDEGGDYFLLENRAQYLFDASLPGQGLVIYHVHPNIEELNSANKVNATHPQGLYPVCASYSNPDSKKYGNINSAECPFPGSCNVQFFSSETSPAAESWNGSSAKIALSDISIGADGVVTFSTGEDFVVEPDETDTLVQKNVVYKESFETGVSDNFLINSVMGKEMWKMYKKGDFIINAESLPNATDGNSIFMLYSGKSSGLSESNAVSVDVKIDSECNYILLFDVNSLNIATSSVPYFSLFVEDENGERNIYNLNEETNGWRSVKVPLTFAGSKIRYRLNGQVTMGGIFVDNILLYKEESAALIEDVGDNVKVCKLYGLDGLYIGEYKEGDHLPSGFYILRQGTLTKKVFVPY